MGKIKVKVNTSKKAIIVFLLMPLIGIGFMIYGIISTINVYDFKDNCRETTGVVVDVSRRLRDSDSDRKKYKYQAIYEYEVDGKTYTVEDNKYSLFKPEMGDEETIYYDVDDPGNAMVHIKESKGIIYVFVGIVVTAMGVIFLVATWKAKKGD